MLFLTRMLKEKIVVYL